jgi:diadenosine tetraphosphate (Ap4A) HIT family hydrolase
MTETCRFCKLARKEDSMSLIYEDDKVMAFLDNRPLSEGHTLVAPKKHYEYIYDVPDDEVGYLFQTVKKVAIAVKKSMKADGITIAQNNGRASGQIIFHVHVHIIPRYEGRPPSRPYEVADKQDLDEVAKRIRYAL